MIAKLVAYGRTRAEALRRARAALDDFRIDGPPTTLALHRRIVRDPRFVAGGMSLAQARELTHEPDA